MTLIIREADRKVRKALNPGVYLGTCYSIIDIGTQHSEKYGNDTHKVVVTFELPKKRLEYLVDGVKKEGPYAMSKRYTLSLNDRANLRRDLEAWRGRSFSKEECTNFDMSKLLGKSCQILIDAYEFDGETYNSIKSLMPLPEGVKPPTAENPLYIWGLDELNKSFPSLPEKIPNWMQAEIKKSKEYLALQDGRVGGIRPVKGAPSIGKQAPNVSDVFMDVEPAGPEDLTAEAPVIVDADTPTDDNGDFIF